MSDNWKQTNPHFNKNNLGTHRSNKNDIIFVISSPDTIIGEDEEKLDPSAASSRFNIAFDGEVSFIKGDYSTIDNNEVVCFKLDENGKHILICVSWGGKYSRTKGKEFDVIESHVLYAQHVALNGGYSGYNYYIVPKEFRMNTDE